MLRHIPTVVLPGQHCSSDDHDMDALKKPKRERRLRHTSPSPTRSRFLRIVRRGDDDATEENGKRPSSPHDLVKRCHSYHDIEQASDLDSSREDHDRDHHSAMSTAAALSSTTPVGTSGGNSAHLLNAEDTRPRKSSGGSHNLFFGHLRFGGKNKGEKKKNKKGDLPSPSGGHDGTLGDPDITLYSVPPETLREWRKSLDVVLQHPTGRVLFHRHLAMEHSLENMQFCKEVDHFKTLPDNKLEKEAHAIAAMYVGEGTPKALNIDSSVVKKVESQLKSPHRGMFDEARQTAYELMAQDSFRRFKTSPDFVRAAQRDITTPTS